MKKIIKISIVLFFIINIFCFGILITNAAGLLPDKPTGNACSNGAAECGNYSLNDMTSVAVKVANLILGIVGSLSLIAFVAGGLMMMLSAGNPEWVKRGKQTLIGAIIGLVIVFTSYAIIYFVFQSLGIKWEQYNMPSPISKNQNSSDFKTTS